LTGAGLVSLEGLNRVLLAQRSDGRRLGELLVLHGLVTEAQVAQTLSQQLSVPWISLGHIVFSDKLLSLISPDLARKHRALPVHLKSVRGLGEVLYLAMDDPTSTTSLRAISEHSGLPTRPMIASPTELTQALAQLYGA
jgi:type IV pilus assembly protein PilB